MYGRVEAGISLILAVWFPACSIIKPNDAVDAGAFYGLAYSAYSTKITIDFFHAQSR